MSSRKRRASEVEEDWDDDYDSQQIGMLPPARLDAVIKLFCTHTEPNYSLPWQMRHQTASTSSGFVIDGQRILTNAHRAAALPWP